VRGGARIVARRVIQAERLPALTRSCSACATWPSPVDGAGRRRGYGLSSRSTQRGSMRMSKGSRICVIVTPRSMRSFERNLLYCSCRSEQPGIRASPGRVRLGGRIEPSLVIGLKRAACLQGRRPTPGFHGPGAIDQCRHELRVS
jgi:hypothetical protein